MDDWMDSLDEPDTESVSPEDELEKTRIAERQSAIGTANLLDRTIARPEVPSSDPIGVLPAEGSVQAEPSTATGATTVMGAAPAMEAAVASAGPDGPSEKPGLLDRMVNDKRFIAVMIVLLIVAALASAFPAREHFADVSTYSDTIATLDEKKANVMGLVAASTAASAGISALPDDMGSPIAEKLMDLSGNLMIILAVIYLEKYLLTIMGAAAFGLLFPVALVLLAASLATRSRAGLCGAMRSFAAKLFILGAVLVLTVPTGVFVTQQIDETYAASVAIQAERDAEEEAAAQEEDEGAGGPLEFIQSLPGRVMDGITSVSEELLDEVNNLIEQTAVMIVTSCVIPILVLVFFLWVGNTLLGINIDAPAAALTARAQRMSVSRRDIDEVRGRVREGKKRRRASKAKGAKAK